MKRPHVYTKLAQLMVVGLALVAGLALGFGMAPLARAAGDIFVRPDGDDDNCNGTTDAAYPGSGGPDLPCAVRTIQKGIQLVDTGGHVHVAAGTYAEDLVIDKALTLSGAGQGSTKLIPATSVPTCTTSSSLCSYNATSMCIVRAANVTIHDLTMDGNNPALTSGEAVNGVDIDARNGIIADFLVVTPHNLTVYNVTVRNIYLNGIYGTGISHVNGLNVHDNVVRNVAGTSNSSAINFYGGSGSLANNTVEDGTVGVVCQQESACLIQNNVITDAQRGIVVASNLTFSGATTVTGNAISGGWTGIDVHHQGQPLTISNNRLDRVTRSIAVGGGSSNPLIEGNQINGTGFSDATGIIVETRGHGGSNQATSAILRDNDIYRTNYGVALYSTASKGVTADLESNLISGTLASSVVITGPGTLDVTLGDSLATANTFRNHGGYLVQLIDTADDVPARFNDWGITALGSIETDIYHQVDNAALGEVLYYGLTAAAAPATLPANGVDAATITATLTGLYAPQGNLVTFAASHGTLSATTDTTDPDEATTSITANATGTAAITATAGYRQATASVSFSPPTPHHFRFAPIPNVVAGVDFTVTITAENSNNSVLTAYDGYALLDDATGTVAPTSVGPFAGGVWTGPISITQVYDGNTLTATYPPDTNITGVSDAFDVVLSLFYQYLPFITRE